MAVYKIATIGDTEESKKYFEIAKAQLPKKLPNTDCKIEFIDITGKTLKEIRRAGTISAFMYFTDIHKTENAEVLKLALSDQLDISDISLFALSHDKVTETNHQEEEATILDYIKDVPSEEPTSSVSVFPVNITSEKEMQAYVDGFVKTDALAFSDYIDEPSNETHRKTEEIVDLYMEAINSKHNYTSGHVKRVATYSKAIAEKLGFSEKEVKQTALVAKLHDIGKLGIPDSILHSSKALTDEQRDQMAMHSAIGSKALDLIISHDESLAEMITPEVQQGINNHHKFWNGKPKWNGPEDPIKGEKIGKFAPIIAVADCIDAMTSQRAYNVPKHIADCFRDLWSNAGRQFSPDVAKTAIIILGEQIASLGYDPVKLISNLENPDEKKAKSDIELKAFFEEYQAEHGNFEVSKNPDKDTYCELGFRLNDEGYFEFEGQQAPVLDHNIAFSSEFDFQKGKLAKNQKIDVDSLSTQDILKASETAKNILAAQREEGKKSIQNSRTHERSIAEEVRIATTEDFEYNYQACETATHKTIEGVNLESKENSQQIENDNSER